MNKIRNLIFPALLIIIFLFCIACLYYVWKNEVSTKNYQLANPPELVFSGAVRSVPELGVCLKRTANKADLQTLAYAGASQIRVIRLQTEYLGLCRGGKSAPECGWQSEVAHEVLGADGSRLVVFGASSTAYDPSAGAFFGVRLDIEHDAIRAYLPVRQINIEKDMSQVCELYVSTLIAPAANALRWQGNGQGDRP